jgi:hypothetical protein
MTTVVILQPGYLPWLGFFRQMIDADVFVYYDDVQFDKHGWRNRNRIKGAAGPLWLTVPVLHKGRSDQLIHETEVANTTPWAEKQLRTIRQLYAKAPHLEPYFTQLSQVLSKPWTHLIDLDMAVVDLMRTWFDISTPVRRSSQLAIGGGKVERLISICRHFNGTRYISGSAAQDYIEEDQFKAAGIELIWQDYRHPVYPQMHGDFISHLSALDLVLNVGPESAAILRQN